MNKNGPITDEELKEICAWLDAEKAATRARLKKWRTEQLPETAHHEAGHAVVAAHLGEMFDYVTVKNTRRALGHVGYSLEAPGTDNETESEYHERLRRSILVDFAGFEAEQLFNPNASEAGARADRRRARARCRTLRLDPAKLRREARQLVWRLRRPIAALAKALLERRTLSYDEACAIVAARPSTRRAA